MDRSNLASNRSSNEAARESAEARWGGGIHADRWMGVIDARAAEGGAMLNDARLVADGRKPTVRGDTIECAINGTVVGSYDRADVVTDGRLASTDGVYGIRIGHNTEATSPG